MRLCKTFWTTYITKMSSIRKIRADDFFYQAGKVIWLPFCIAGFWFAGYGYEKYKNLAECAVKKRCGLPCPGCGGTRAFYYLFQGEFVKSFFYNPVVVYGTLAYIHYMLLYFYRKNISKTVINKEIHIEYYMYLAIGVLLIQWIIKLIIILFSL